MFTFLEVYLFLGVLTVIYLIVEAMRAPMQPPSEDDDQPPRIEKRRSNIKDRK